MLIHNHRTTYKYLHRFETQETTKVKAMSTYQGTTSSPMNNADNAGKKRYKTKTDKRNAAKRSHSCFDSLWCTSESEETDMHTSSACSKAAGQKVGGSFFVQNCMPIHWRPLAPKSSRLSYQHYQTWYTKLRPCSLVYFFNEGQPV